MNKKIVWGVLVLGVFLGLGYLYNQKNEEFKLITDETEMTEFVMTHSQEELDEYYRKVDELKASDIYGGKTPEETLSLYTEALKIGDVQLASKYFRLEDQEKKLNELKELNDEQMSNLIEMLSSGEDSFCDKENLECDINGSLKNVDILVVKLIKIKQSGLWKLKSI